MNSFERADRDRMIIELYQSGMTMEEVAHEVLLTRPQIVQILKALHVPARKTWSRRAKVPEHQITWQVTPE